MAYLLETGVKASKLVVYGAFGGRIDHTFNAIAVISRLQEALANMELILMDKSNCMIYLEPGTHKIILSTKLEAYKWCGFYPICSASSMVAT